MKLTLKEKQAVYRAVEMIKTWKTEFSCVALYRATNHSPSLCKKYRKFYEKSVGDDWGMYEHSVSSEAAKAWRIMLLLWFAEVEGNL